MELEALLKATERLRSSSAQIEKEQRRKDKKSATSSISRNIMYAQKIFGNSWDVIKTTFFVFKDWALPVAHFLRVTKWLNGYKYFFKKFAYLKDSDGDRVYDAKRGAATIVGLTVGTYVFVWFAIPFMTEVAWDAFWITFFSKEETVYLTNSEEVDYKKNVHTVKGCYNLPCSYDLSSQDSISFRIRNSYFLDIEHLLFGNGLFYPDLVAAAVPPVVSKCTVDSFGFRWRFLMRTFQMWPYIKSVSCAPITTTQGS